MTKTRNGCPADDPKNTYNEWDFEMYFAKIARQWEAIDAIQL